MVRKPRHDITTAGTSYNRNNYNKHSPATRDIRKDIKILGWMIDWEFTIGWLSGYIIYISGITIRWLALKNAYAVLIIYSYSILKGHGWIMSNYTHIILIIFFVLFIVCTQMFFPGMEKGHLVLIYNTGRKTGIWDFLSLSNILYSYFLYSKTSEPQQKTLY